MNITQPGWAIEFRLPSTARGQWRLWWNDNNCPLRTALQEMVSKQTFIVVRTHQWRFRLRHRSGAVYTGL